MTRCNHRGSACAHVQYTPQAYKVGPEPATWADVREAVAGLAVLLLFGVGGWMWLAIASAVQP